MEKCIRERKGCGEKRRELEANGGSENKLKVKQISVSEQVAFGNIKKIL